MAMVQTLDVAMDKSYYIFPIYMGKNGFGRKTKSRESNIYKIYT